MTKIFSRIGILSFLLLFSFQLESSAQSTFANKCSAFGEIPIDDNPSKQHINCLLTNAAIEADIPPEVVKAVVTTENGSWHHFKSKGVPNIAADNGIGLMQVTDRLPNVTPEQQVFYEKRLATDIVFNIEEGIRILNEKYTYNLPKIVGANRQHIESWYFAVMAYNGTVQKNRPIFLASGLSNTGAYQEKVFAAIEKDSFLNNKYPAESILAKYPFKPEHFPNVGTISIGFNVKSYTLNEPLHSSVYNVKQGDQVVLTASANVREQPNTASDKIEYPKGTILKVEGDFAYTIPSNSLNQFVWFPTKDENGTLSGYISSAYIEKVEQSQLDVTAPTLPVVNAITDNAKTITGETEPFADVYVKINNELLTTTANTKGQFTLNLSKPLLAYTSVSIYAVDLVGNKGKTTVVKVKDVTAPTKAKVNEVRSNSKTISGTAEASSTVTAYVGKEVIEAKVTSKGKFSMSILPQKVGTKITVEVADRDGNKSKTTVTVKLQTPTVTKVSTKTVTGKGLVGATVQVHSGQKIGEAIVDRKGNFTVTLKPAQKKNTTLKVTLRNKTGHTSSVTVKVK